MENDYDNPEEMSFEDSIVLMAVDPDIQRVCVEIRDEFAQMDMDGLVK